VYAANGDDVAVASVVKVKVYLKQIIIADLFVHLFSLVARFQNPKCIH